VSFIGLPGNPVAVFVTFALLVRPFLLRMQGVADIAPPPVMQVRADFDWPRPDRRRREYLRARLITADDGAAAVQIYPNQSSGVLISASWANGLVEVPEGQPIRRADMGRFIPFAGILC